MFADSRVSDVCYFSERLVSEDTDWAVLSSYKSGNNYPAVPVQISEEISPGPLDKFFHLADFSEDAYTEARRLNVNSWTKIGEAITKDNEDENNLHYSRLLSYYNEIVTEGLKQSNQFINYKTQDPLNFKLLPLLSAPWVTNTLPGMDPKSNWPFSQKDLLNRLKQMPPLALWFEPFDKNYEFFKAVQEFIKENQGNFEYIANALQIMLLFGFLTGNGTRLAIAFGEMHKSGQGMPEELLQEISETCQPHMDFLQTIIKQNPQAAYIRSNSTKGRFTVATHNNFSKGHTIGETSITTDGTYLYIYAPTPEGGMFKVGTGNGSLCGKVYLFANAEPQEEGKQWVYCKGKLYAKTGSREMGTLAVYCPNTFKREGLIQLYTPEIFSTSTMQTINKGYPLLTDGEYVYTIFMKTNKEVQKEEVKEAKRAPAPPNKVKAQLFGNSGEDIDQAQKQLEQEQQKQEDEALAQAIAASIEESKIIEAGQSQEGQEIEIDWAADQEQGAVQENQAQEAQPEAQPVEIDGDNNQANPEQVEVEQPSNQSENQPAAEQQDRDNNEALPEQENQPELNNNNEPSSDAPQEQQNQDAESSPDVAVEPELQLASLQSENPENGALQVSEVAGSEPVMEISACSEVVESNSHILDDIQISLDQPPPEAQELPPAQKPASPAKSQEEQKKAPNDAKAEKPSLMEFFLYKFDVSQIQNTPLNISQVSEEAKEIYESFSCYFSLSECVRALAINNQDINAAVQWLVDSGDKERGKKMVVPISKTLLAQAQIQNFTQARGNKPDITLKGDSVLLMDMVYKGVWTINDKYISVVWVDPDEISSTSRVFSILPQDEGFLSKNAHVCPGTLNQVGNLDINIENVWDNYLNKEYTELRGTHISNFVSDNTVVGSPTCYDKLTQQYYSCIISQNKGMYVYIRKDGTKVFQNLPNPKNPPRTPFANFTYTGLNSIIQCEKMRKDLPWRRSSVVDNLEAAKKLFDYLKGSTSNQELSATYSNLSKRMEGKIKSALEQEYLDLAEGLGFTPIQRKNKQNNCTHQSSDIIPLRTRAKVKEDQLVVAQERPIATIEVTREAVNSLESNENSLMLVLELFEDGLEMYALDFLIMWLCHRNREVRKVELYQRLDELLWHLASSHDKNISTKAWNAVIIGWDSICYEQEISIKWFRRILEMSSGDIPQSRRKDSFIYSIQSKSKTIPLSSIYQPSIDPLILWHRLNIAPINSIIPKLNLSIPFRKQFDIYVDKRAEPTLQGSSAIKFLQCNPTHMKNDSPKLPQIGAIWDLLETCLVESINDPQSQNTSALFDIFEYIVKAHLESKQVDCDAYFSLMGRLLDLLFSDYNQRVSTMHTSWISNIRRLLTIGVNIFNQYNNSISPKLVSLFKKIKNLFIIDNKNLLDTISFANYVGADKSSERIFETSHPYQRGKTQICENVSFPGAVAIVVEIDPRSQCDRNYDYMIIAANENGTTNKYSSEVLSTNIRLSDRFQPDTRLLIQGSHAYIEFKSSTQPREEGLSNRWGFKIFIRPMYGEAGLFINDESNTQLLTKLQLRLGSEQEIISWISLLSWYNYVLSSRISQMLRADSLDSDILNWTLFSGGINSIQLSDLLDQQNGMWEVKKEIQETYHTLGANAQGLEDKLLSMQPDLILVKDLTSGLYNLLDAVRGVCPIPPPYQAEKMRASFTKEFQDLWIETEGLALFTMLYHTQHLKSITGTESALISDERYKREQLNALGKRVNEIILWMLLQVQSEKEKMQAIIEINELKDQAIAAKRKPEEQKEKKVNIMRVRTTRKNVRRLNIAKGKTGKKAAPVQEEVIVLQEADKLEIFEKFKERYIGNENLIKGLCKRLKLDFKETNVSLQEVFDLIWEMGPMQESPYRIVADHVRYGLLVLLFFEPTIPKLDSEEEDLPEVPTLNRANTSFSVEDTHRLEEMRKWVDQYKKWKQWQDPTVATENLQDTQSSPLKAICKFVTLEQFPDNIEQIAWSQSKAAAKRLCGLQYLAKILKYQMLSPNARQLTGLLPEGSLLGKVRCCGAKIKELCKQYAGSIIKILAQMLQQQVQSLTSVGDLKAQSSRTNSKFLPSSYKFTEDYLNTQFKGILIILRDMNVLLNSTEELLFNSLTLEKLIQCVMIALKVSTSVSKTKVSEKLVKVCKLLLFTLIDKLQREIPIEHKRMIVESIMETSLIDIERILENRNLDTYGTLELYLHIIFEVFRIEREKIVTARLGRILLSIIKAFPSPLLVRLSCRLAEKILPFFGNADFTNGGYINELLQLLGRYININENPSSPQNQSYTVLIHNTGVEEHLPFLFTVLYEWETRYPTERYLSFINELDQPENSNDGVIVEEISNPFLYEGMQPSDINDSDGKIAYYRQIMKLQENARGRGRGRRAKKMRQEMGKRPAAPKKFATSHSLARLEKHFEEVSKGFEDVKEGDSEEVKERKGKEKNFNKRIRWHIKENQNIGDNLQNKGVATVFKKLTMEKAMELMELINKTQEKIIINTNTKLPIIPENPFKVKEGQTEAITTETIEPKRLYVVTLCESEIASRLDFQIDACSNLSIARYVDKLAGIISGPYTAPFLQQNFISGESYSLCIYYITNLLIFLKDKWTNEFKLAREQAIGLLNSGQELQEDQTNFATGCLGIVAGYKSFIRPGIEVITEHNKSQERGVVVQGGNASGMKNALVLFLSETNFAPIAIPLKEISPRHIKGFTEDLDIDQLSEIFVRLDSEKSGDWPILKHLLLSLIQMDLSSWYRKSDKAELLLQKLAHMSQQCPLQKSIKDCEFHYNRCWEILADTRQPLIMSMPFNPDNQVNGDNFLKPVNEEESIFNYTLPTSSYLSSLPELTTSPADATNFKMLKHWEKNIIARIQDFVRSSFKPYEMQYFFEQLRQPLRIGDQTKATEIAYVLCDQRLPSGVVMPDPKHDWNALTLDEAVIGAQVLVKLKPRLINLTSYGNILRRLYSEGVTEVSGVIRVVDIRLSVVLIEFVDHERLDIYQCWVPISYVYNYELPLTFDAVGAATGGHFNQISREILGMYSRMTLYNLLPTLNVERMGLAEMIKLATWAELRDQSNEGGLFIRKDYFCPEGQVKIDSVSQYVHEFESHENSTLSWLESELIPQNEDKLVEWALLEWNAISEELNESTRSINLLDAANTLMGSQIPLQSTPENILASNSSQRKFFPLHPSNSDYSGLILCFTKDSFMCNNSVIQFFADPYGKQMIYEILAGRQGRSSLPPVVFEIGKVWCTYYTFIDVRCSPYNELQTGPTVLNCKAVGIPKNWTTAVWVTEAVSSSLCNKPSEDSISMIHSLNLALTEFLSSTKVPISLRSILYRLLTRIIRRLRFLNSKFPLGIGISVEWFQQVLEEMKRWRDDENSGSDTLFSQYIQEGAELLVTAQLPWDITGPAESNLGLGLPDWLGYLYKTTRLLNYFRREGALPSDIESEINELLVYDQWKNIIILNSLPAEEDVKGKLVEILKQHKVRISNIDTDVVVDGSLGLILIDELTLQFYKETDFEEEEKKEEVEEDAKEPEGWECGICTFLNGNSNSVCEMCQTPKPAEMAAVETQHTDVREIEKKLMSKRSLVIEEIMSKFRELEYNPEVYNKDSHADKIKQLLFARTIQNGELQSDIKQWALDLINSKSNPLQEIAPGGLDEFIQKANTDALQLYLDLQSQGLDFWLQLGLKHSPRAMTITQFQALMELVEFRICQETRAALYIMPSFLRLPLGAVNGINTYSEYPGQDINSFTLSELRYNWAVLRVFNRYLSECLGLINLSHNSLMPRGSYALSISSALSQARALIMLPVKTEIQQQVFDKTAVIRETAPKVILERLKTQDATGKNSIFLRAFEQLKSISPAALRVPRPQGSDPFIAFEVVFKNEMVVGEAGPYRQFFADLSKDLIIEKPGNFLVPSQNNKGKYGEGSDNFVVNPSCGSASDLQMYEFLGVLLGCCARTGARLTLNLPSFFWKPLVGEFLKFDDLSKVDSPVAEMLKLMETATSELFEESFENFSIRLSDDTMVDLVPNGRFIPVTFENKQEYINSVLLCRFSECQKQCEAIRLGLSKLVPSALLSLLTWRQLEELVCGKHEVDIELLKRHTRYSGGLTESSQRVTWLWEILHEFTHEERMKFIKFCWGQERLPGNDEDFARTNTRFMLKPAMSNQYGDGALPHADTCFFNLSIPEYSSKEVMKERIRFAILTDCESMNADNPMSEQQEAGFVRGEHYSDEEDEFGGQ